MDKHLKKQIIILPDKPYKMANHTAEQIKYVADTLMPNFIPKDSAASILSFAFTLDGVNYEVSYEKDRHGDWQLTSHRKA